MAPKKAAPVPARKETPSLPSDVEDLKAEIDRQIGSLVNQSNRGEIVTRMVSVVQERFSGPIAHPRHLRAYDDIVPGSAERIIRMAEKAQDHNAGMIRKLLMGRSMIRNAACASVYSRWFWCCASLPASAIWTSR
ncbi:MAG: DUF2335 domain-containing protein [Mesorhizobium sp.]|nr:MAG: DUF2335 domain-containing protein [Mesorhizobium sp.]